MARKNRDTQALVDKLVELMMETGKPTREDARVIGALLGGFLADVEQIADSLLTIATEMKMRSGRG